MLDVKKEVLAMRDAIKAMPVERQPGDEHIPFSSNKLESDADRTTKLHRQVKACLDAEHKKPLIKKPLITKKGTGGDASFTLTDPGEALVKEYHDFLVHELVTGASERGSTITPEKAAVLLQEEGRIAEKQELNGVSGIGINGIIKNDIGIVDAAIERVQEAMQSNDGGLHVVQQRDELSQHTEGSGSVAPFLVQQEQEHTPANTPSAGADSNNDTGRAGKGSPAEAAHLLSGQGGAGADNQRALFNEPAEFASETTVPDNTKLKEPTLSPVRQGDASLSDQDVDEDSDDEASPDGGTVLETSSNADRNAGSKTNIVHDGTPWCGQMNGSTEPSGTPSIHPPQKLVAGQLYEAMEKAMENSQQDLSKFDKFEFRILVPNLNTLFNQTATRLEEFVKERQARNGKSFFRRCTNAEDLVYKTNKSDPELKKRERLLDEIEANKTTLFLIVRDEAHYEATRDGAADKFINDVRLRCAKNVLCLSVSATPYNLLTHASQIPRDNVITWTAGGNKSKIATAVQYFGLAHYQEHVHNSNADQAKIEFGSLCATDAGFLYRYKALLETTKNKKQALLETLVTEYCDALREVVKKDNGMIFPEDQSVVGSSMTRRMIKDLVNRPVEEGGNGKGWMILIRQPAGTSETGRAIFEALKRVRNDMGLNNRFAVLIDLDSGRATDNRLMKCITDHNPCFEEQMQKLNKGNGPKQYSDLEGLPCILILCEKGKMGTLTLVAVCSCAPSSQCAVLIFFRVLRSLSFLLTLSLCGGMVWFLAPKVTRFRSQCGITISGCGINTQKWVTAHLLSKTLAVHLGIEHHQWTCQSSWLAVNACAEDLWASIPTAR